MFQRDPKNGFRFVLFSGGEGAGCLSADGTSSCSSIFIYTFELKFGFEILSICGSETAGVSSRRYFLSRLIVWDKISGHT